MLHKLLACWIGMLWACCLPQAGWAQPGHSAVLPPIAQKPDFHVPSPTVASLGKFGLTPVAYYTGLPQVSVPLWEVKGHSLRLPISLNYNNNGLKLAEQASWVGLGWALQAGGIITQNVRGGADDLHDGSYTPLDMQPYNQIPSNIIGFNSTAQLLMNRIANGKIDSSPDIFIFNFGTYSGRFVLFQNKAYQFTYADLQISYDNSAGVFTIITGEGITYRFTKRETTLSQNSSPQPSPFGSYHVSMSSSWLLTSVTSADKQDTITLTYESTAEQVTTTQVQDDYSGMAIDTTLLSGANNDLECRLYGLDGPFFVTSQARTTTTAYRLVRIESTAEKIEFVAQPSARQDVDGTAYALQRIDVYDKQQPAQNPVRSFAFYQSYFSQNWGNMPTTPEFGRLRLDSLQEIGFATSRKPPYRFTYQQGLFPSRKSRDVDHWGFFNNAGNTTLVPATRFLPFSQGARANRRPNFTAAQLGVLQQITYPTGGYERFLYEPNRYRKSADSTTLTGPGLRVRRIESQAATGSLSYRTFYYEIPTNDLITPQYEKVIYNVNPGTYCDCCTTVQVTGGNPDVMSMFGSVIYYTKVIEQAGLNGEGGQTTYYYEGIGDPHWANGMNLVRKIIQTKDQQLVSEEITHYGGKEDLSLPIFINPTVLAGPLTVSPYGNSMLAGVPGQPQAGPYCIRADPNCGNCLLCTTFSRTDPVYSTYSSGPLPGPALLSVYAPTFIALPCIWNPVISKTIRLYDTKGGTAASVTTTQLFYDKGDSAIFSPVAHRYVTREQLTDSKGQQRIRQLRYPSDYNTKGIVGTDPYYQALQRLTELHIVNTPIEQLSLVTNGTDTTVVGGQLTLYKRFGAGSSIYPAALLSLDATSPLPYRHYSWTQGSSLSWDRYFAPRLTYRYDPTGAILEWRKNQLQYACLRHPITHEVLVEAQNARWSQLAYTSFEVGATGRWTYDSLGTHRQAGMSRTGTWAYLLDGQGSAITRAQLPAGDYELTYWVNGSGPAALTLSAGSQRSAQLVATVGAWHCYQVQLQLTATSQVSVDKPASAPSMLLDELRLQPLGAHLTTYTYAPLVGVTSQTGPDGRTTFYDYDGLGRLLRTRDDQGHILSQQQYHYAGTK